VSELQDARSLLWAQDRDAAQEAAEDERIARKFDARLQSEVEQHTHHTELLSACKHLMANKDGQLVHRHSLELLQAAINKAEPLS
jgi:hypothetical protein